MSPISRTRWGAACLGVTLAGSIPLAAEAAAELQVYKIFGGEFQSLGSAHTLSLPETLHFRWSTDQAGVAKARWVVKDLGATGIASVAGSGGGYAQATNHPVVTSGTTWAVPAAGGHAVFTIPGTSYLVSPGTPSTRRFAIQLTPLNALGQPLGTVSPAVTVTQVPLPPGNSFGRSAHYPKVEVVSYDENVGVVPQTQIHYGGASVTLRVTNATSTVTDPAHFTIVDRRLLMRQNVPKVYLAGMPRHSSKTITVPIEAVLPPSTSQMGQSQQWASWLQSYHDRCGVELNSVFDFAGPLNQAPVGDHVERPLVGLGFSAWADGAKVDEICWGKTCVDVCRMEKSIRSRLDGHVVGYSFLAGQYPKFGAGGRARTIADGTERPFTPQTKITVASVSKLITALATIAVIDRTPEVTLDSSIGRFLPSDWTPSEVVKAITFRQLLSQTSGIKDYGNVTLSYGKLKSFFEAPIANANQPDCKPATVIDPLAPIHATDRAYCYSNYNTAILRLVLPRLAGFAEEPNKIVRPGVLAAQYQSIVQDRVFERVGRQGVLCKPPSEQPAASNYAFAYTGPGGGESGTDFGDVSSICGAAGWYLSAEDMGAVLMSLSAGDGRILDSDGLKTLRLGALGLDTATPSELQKNGGWGTGTNNISTSAAIFGPVIGPRALGVLFINSNIVGGPHAGQGAQQVLEAAYAEATFTRP